MFDIWKLGIDIWILMLENLNLKIEAIKMELASNGAKLESLAKLLEKNNCILGMVLGKVTAIGNHLSNNKQTVDPRECMFNHDGRPPDIMTPSDLGLEWSYLILAFFF